ncbi:hypothetical protein ACHQM5_021147 [Ranunculus cassubicifolius]
MAAKQNENISPSSTPPKLSLFSLPNHQLLPEPPGMLTPPLQRTASIPFLWEEAPGKPLFSSSMNTTKISRCLELPPRLLSSEIKLTDIPSSSPSTVLDGPYVSRSLSAREKFTLFQEIGSISKRRDESSNKGSGTWGIKKGGSKRNTRVCEDSCDISPSSSSFGGFGNRDSVDHTKVKITRIKRTGSFFSLSQSKPHHTHIWASIYGTFKQVVPLPWRTRKTKKEGQSI